MQGDASQKLKSYLHKMHYLDTHFNVIFLVGPVRNISTKESCQHQR